MSNKVFTIDEWIAHYFYDSYKFKFLAKFFITLYKVCDKIAFKNNTPLAKKIYEIFEFKKSDKCTTEQRELINFFLKNIFMNSDKRVDINIKLKIPNECKEILHRKDHYLLEMVYNTNTKILITTDEKLFKQILSCKEKFEIDVFLADEFMEKYVYEYNN